MNISFIGNLAKCLCVAWTHRKTRPEVLEETIRRLGCAADVEQAVHHRKLYRIRLQNGDTVYLQADSEAQAIRYAGLDIGSTILAAVRKQQGKDIDLAEMQYELLCKGVGPQNFIIRECVNFHARFHLTNDGDFEAFLNSDAAHQELQIDYPELAEMDRQLTEIVLGNDCLAMSKEEQELRANAVLKERTRLTALLLEERPCTTPRSLPIRCHEVKDENRASDFCAVSSSSPCSGYAISFRLCFACSADSC